MELVINNLESANLKAALAYAAIGWYVFPVWPVKNGVCGCGVADCKNTGKHPHSRLAPFGQSAATTDQSKIRQWWTQDPNANIGVFLERSGLCALDIDPRNGGYFTIDDLEDKYGPLSSDVLQFTGGGGEHRIFQKPVNQMLPGKLGAGVDVKLNGYIVVWPSVHHSGNSYSWEGSSNPIEGAITSPLPDFLRSLAYSATQAETSPPPLDPLKQEQIDEITAALAYINSDDRQVWLDVGMALHNDLGGQQAFDLWCTWSAASTKFNNKGQVTAWNSFKRRGISGITKATIFKLAMDSGWNKTAVTPEFTPVEIPETIIYQPIKEESKPAAEVHPRGALGAIEDYYNATAKIQQPGFAIQTALGIGSVILGRMFKTSNNNYSSLYFLNIAGSAKGKEHIKTVTENVLDACGFGDRIANDGYTSQGAVFGALMDRPCHITVIDELGYYLENTSNKANFIGKGANDALMQVITRNEGKYRNKNFAPNSKNSDLSHSHVTRPAITLQGMTTPSKFYENITLSQVQDGFLGRFIMHHSKMPRTIPSIRDNVEVPDSVIEWATQIKERLAAHDPYNTATSLDNAVEAISLQITPKAKDHFNAFSQSMVDLMDELDSQGIESLAGRCGDFAMRLALISALSRNAYAEVITLDDAQFGCSYMNERALEMISEVKANLHGSQFAKDTKDVLDIIRAAGVNGLTIRDTRRTKGLMRYKDKELHEILNSLKNGGYIEYGNVREGKQGTKREAFYALELEE